MPGVYPPNNFASVLRQLALRLRAVETQQQGTFSNSVGLPLISTGCQVDPNNGYQAQYGFKFWNPPNGQPLAFFGEDTTGDVALYYYNASGQKTSQYDHTGLHFYNSSGVETCRIDGTGLHVYDSSDNNRVNAGELANGDYGLQVIDPSGQSNEILPQYVSAEGGSGPVTQTTPYSLPGTSITVAIGESGNAMVTLIGNGEMNGPATGGGSAYFAVGVDGVAPSASWSELQTNLSAAQLTAPVYVGREWTGLTPGSHSFEAYVWSDSTGHSVNLEEAYVLVRPL